MTVSYASPSPILSLSRESIALAATSINSSSVGPTIVHVPTVVSGTAFTQSNPQSVAVSIISLIKAIPRQVGARRQTASRPIRNIAHRTHMTVPTVCCLRKPIRRMRIPQLRSAIRWTAAKRILSARRHSGTVSKLPVQNTIMTLTEM